MVTNTLCAIIGLTKKRTITNSTHTLTLGRLAYIYHVYYDQRYNPLMCKLMRFITRIHNMGTRT